MKTLRCAALALALTGTGAAVAETLSVPVPLARGLARNAFLAGEFQLANELAHALLQARPDDTAALLLLAATEPMLGRAAAGRKAGRAAWRSTDVEGLKHEAAFYTARAALIEGRFTASQIWLRRAYETTDDEAKRDSIALDYQRLRAVNPWTSSLSFSISPSSNLNDGSSYDLLLIEDLPIFGYLSGSAQALSGTTTSVEASLGYKILRSSTQETELRFTGLHTFNTLSSEAKEIAPDTRGSDFNQALVEASLLHRRADLPAFVPDTYELSAGKRYFGGEALDDYARLALQRDFSLSDGVALRLGGAAEQHWSQSGAEDSLGVELTAQLATELPWGDVLSFGLSGSEAYSDSDNQSYTGWQAIISYEMAEPVGPVALALSLGYEVSDYPVYDIGIFAVPGGREDEEVTAALEMRFPGVSVMGFDPVVTVSGAWSNSNISRFEGETAGLSLGFRSAF